jgi:maleylpyruvate isomerase
MPLVTEERDEWVIGDGALRVTSDREGLLQWLARGEAAHVEADGLPLPCQLGERGQFEPVAS